MDLSFIILNYKTKGLLKNCLQSLLRSNLAGLKYEVIVVDNNSGDGVKEMLEGNFTNIIFIQARYNLGMGAGNNLGIKQASGKYAVVLNADIFVLPETFKRLYDFMEQHPACAVTGPALINPDGSLQHTRCRFPSFLIPVYRRTPLQKLKNIRRNLDLYLTKDQDYNVAGKADWLYGACLFIRREALEKAGYFDERYFLGFEDTDLCRRFWQSGWEVWYNPDSILIHYPHRFSGDSNWLTGIFNKNIRIHINSWLKYFFKWGSSRQPEVT